jgi:hypothetical protein
MRRRAISKSMEHELECALAPRVVEVERVERAETRLGAPIALRERPERLQQPQPRVAISGHQWPSEAIDETHLQPTRHSRREARFAAHVCIQKHIERCRDLVGTVRAAQLLHRLIGGPRELERDVAAPALVGDALVRLEGRDPSEIERDRARWSEMERDGARWSKIERDGARLSGMGEIE